MNKYMWIKPYINEQYNKFYENNVIKTRLMEFEFLHEIDSLYDNMIDYIYDIFEYNNNYIPYNILHKFTDYLLLIHNNIKSLYYGL